MSLVVLGVNQRTTPLDVLERLTISPARRLKALDDLRQRDHISEAVVLSTCNRLEVYAHAERFHGAYQDVRDFMAEFSGLAPEDFAEYLYVFYDRDALEHLFRVASGLESAVLGEHEIQGQVKKSWEAAQEAGTAGTTLNGAFRHAVRVGKRARTDTAIGRGIASVSHAAVVLADQHLGGLANKRVFVLGAGDMGGGMAGHFASVDLEDLVVASRTWARASELAERFGGRAVHLDQVENELIEADVLLTSTAATSFMVEYDQLARVAAARNHRELLVVDVAVPRDVDPACKEIPGITLLDMAAVTELTATGIDGRSDEVAKVNAIIEVEVDRYAEQMSAREVAPLIGEIRARAEELRIEELDRHRAKLAQLGDDERELIDFITKGVLNKLLHQPTVRLRQAAESSRGDRLAIAARDLFALDDERDPSA